MGALQCHLRLILPTILMLANRDRFIYYEFPRSTHLALTKTIHHRPLSHHRLTTTTWLMTLGMHSQTTFLAWQMRKMKGMIAHVSMCP